MSDVVEVEGLSTVFGEILDVYSEEVKEKTAEASKKAAAYTIRMLKATSPKDSGEYASGWKQKSYRGGFRLVYNEKKPQLTHLLNNGHIIRNGVGTYDYMPGDGHITRAEEQGNAKFVEEVKRRL